jgi:hypothetical protein
MGIAVLKPMLVEAIFNPIYSIDDVIIGMRRLGFVNRDSKGKGCKI